MESFALAVIWLDRSDKAYWYGPFRGEHECHLGFLWLSDLWSDGLKSGRLGIYKNHLSAPPWLEEPTRSVTYGTQERPWLVPIPGSTIPYSGYGPTQGFPMNCKDRPVQGHAMCVLLADHSGEHEYTNE